MLEVGPNDDGREIVVACGERLVVRLPESAATGYRWEGPTPDCLRLLRDDYDVVEAAPGAAADRVLEYLTERRGRCTLSFSRKRAWGSAIPEDGTFGFVVVVE